LEFRLAHDLECANMQVSIAEEARKRGLVAQDALLLFPPTRTYTNAEVRQGLASDGVDGVLVVNVADTGVLQQYAGTILTGQYSGANLTLTRGSDHYSDGEIGGF